MMIRAVRSIAVLWTLLALTAAATGCTVFNPYESKFMCEDSADHGKCASLKQAYRESLEEQAEDNELVMTKSKSRTAPSTGNIKTDAPEPEPPGVDYVYHDNLYREMAGLIAEPQTPVLVPAKPVRVLILNYTNANDEDVLYGHRFVYFIATQPKWMLDPLEVR